MRRCALNFGLTVSFRRRRTAHLRCGPSAPRYPASSRSGELLGEAPPLSSNITLEIELHLPAGQLLQAGDLDNFVTGVCDGLQAADPRARLDPRWQEPANRELDPSRSIAIQDDSAVVSIRARKSEEAVFKPWYCVTLIGDQ